MKVWSKIRIKNFKTFDDVCLDLEVKFSNIDQSIKLDGDNDIILSFTNGIMKSLLKNMIF